MERNSLAELIREFTEDGYKEIYKLDNRTYILYNPDENLSPLVLYKENDKWCASVYIPDPIEAIEIGLLEYADLYN